MATAFEIIFPAELVAVSVRGRAFDRFAALKFLASDAAKLVRSLCLSVWLLAAAVARLSKFEIGPTGVNTAQRLTDVCKSHRGFDRGVANESITKANKTKQLLNL